METTMSNADDFTAIQSMIDAIPDEQIIPPAMPIEVFLQEAENLFLWCADDKEQLSAAGLDWTLVDELPVRSGALRHAESLWYKNRHTHKSAEKEWREKSPTAFDLRSSLLHDLRFAFRNNAGLTGKVRQITGANSHASLIQDLNGLSVLGKSNSGLLTAIGFDMGLLDTAAALSDELADLLARVIAGRATNNTSRITRNKAHTLLKQTVDEIRVCGRYVFWRTPQRSKGYVSHYYKRLNNIRIPNEDILPPKP
jgi:hypothetical protein